MSTKYTLGKEVPTKTLCDRLDELSKAVTNGRDSINREFYMRIPAEVDNDADLVIGEASCRIKRLEKELDELKEATRWEKQFRIFEAGFIGGLKQGDYRYGNEEGNIFGVKQGFVNYMCYLNLRKKVSDDLVDEVERDIGKLPKTKQEGAE